MELESQRVISKDVTEKSSHDPSLYKQRAIFYISVNGLILTALFMDYKVSGKLITSSFSDIIT
jgi:hypothetical protein